MSKDEQTKISRGEILWAPWRIEYILEEKKGECLFCRKAESKEDDRNYVLYRSDHSFALLNTFPYNSGHILIAPYRHTAELENLVGEEIFDLLESLQKCLRALKTVMKPDGFNVGFNLGKSAGAGVVDHLHLHLVPRWEGDTNYMPVIANTRVIPQSLRSVYDLLSGALFSP